MFESFVDQKNHFHHYRRRPLSLGEKKPVVVVLACRGRVTHPSNWCLVSALCPRSRIAGVSRSRRTTVIHDIQRGLRSSARLQKRQGHPQDTRGRRCIRAQTWERSREQIGTEERRETSGSDSKGWPPSTRRKKTTVHPRDTREPRSAARHKRTKANFAAPCTDRKRNPE